VEKDTTSDKYISGDILSMDWKTLRTFAISACPTLPEKPWSIPNGRYKTILNTTRTTPPASSVPWSTSCRHASTAPAHPI